MMELVLPGDNGSEAVDINDRGQIAGNSCNVTGTCGAFRWDQGQMIALGDLPGGANYSFATAIDNKGEVVGSSNVGFTTVHAFIWQDGIMTDLGVLPGMTSCNARDINNQSVIVGACNAIVSNKYKEKAFVWLSGALTELPLLNATQDSIRAAAINDAGLIVGSTANDDANQLTAILWQDGVAYDLNDFVPSDDPLKPYVSLTGAFRISNRGQILAAGHDSRMPNRIFEYLLTPTHSHKTDDSHGRGDDSRGRGDDSRGRGDDSRGRGDDSRGRGASR